MGNAGSSPRDRHKSGDSGSGHPSSPGKDGQAFVFDKKHNALVLQGSHEDEEPCYTRPQSASEATEYIDIPGQRGAEPSGNERLIPTVFKWDGGGHQVYMSGTFTNWKTIPMVKSHGDFVTIVDLPEGGHQYKFLVDGDWKHNPAEPTVDNPMGTKNNLIEVKKTDFEVFEALASDIISSTSQVSGSPPGEYSQDVPSNKPWDKPTSPPVLPPHLLQVILNKDTPLSVSYDDTSFALLCEYLLLFVTVFLQKGF